MQNHKSIHTLNDFLLSEIFLEKVGNMGMSPATRFLGFLCSMISCEVLFPPPNVLPNVSLNYEHQPVLRTVYGEVQGHYMTTIKGRNVASFEGLSVESYFFGTYTT